VSDAGGILADLLPGKVPKIDVFNNFKVKKFVNSLIRGVGCANFSRK
jgi:hypothetical protein